MRCTCDCATSRKRSPRPVAGKLSRLVVPGRSPPKGIEVDVSKARVREVDRSNNPGVLPTIHTMFRAYPAQSSLVVSLTFLSGMAEAVGVVALLPLLGLAMGDEADVPLLDTLLTNGLERIGLAPTLEVLLMLIVAGITVKGLLKIVAMRQAGYAAARVGRDLRLGLIRALMQARWGYFTSQPVGRLANAVSSEAQRASSVFTKSCDLLARLIQVMVYLTLAFVVSWQVALVTLGLGAVMISSLHFLVRMTRQAGLRQTQVLRSLISRLSDGLYAIKPLKAMGKEGNLQPLLEEEVEELNHAQERQVISKATLENAHEPVVTLFVSIIIYVLLSGLGVPFSEVLFIAFLFYRTTTYVATLQKGVQAFVEMESAYWSIRTAIVEAEQATERLGGDTDISLRKQIEFRDVSFGYDERPVLDSASFSVPARAMTAFIGPSGSGKTTIADLTAALYVPVTGAIFVDDVDLARADVRAWRQQIGYVPQDMTLFHDSVFVNVGMGDAHVTRDDVEEALRDAGAWEFVSTLPDGMDTLVGEHGMRFSGGQRQRLAIARALVRKPQLLILDEATTALDPATEQAILATLSTLKTRVTMVAISHQAGIVDAADHVIRLEPGARGAVLHEDMPGRIDR
jgi:ATP-binding cassette, subfamily C, bacterial